MKKLFRWKVLGWVVLTIGIVLIAIQFVPVTRPLNPPVTFEVPASPDMRVILRRACYDCHSNETAWPWYSRVAPVSWLVARDVRKGRSKLNFSTWDRYSAQQQAKRLQKSFKEVAEGEMPLWFYVPLHRDAVLSPQDRSTFRNWAMGKQP